MEEKMFGTTNPFDGMTFSHFKEGTWKALFKS